MEGEVDLGYRGSSLSLPAPAREGRILPGDRAPDAPLHGLEPGEWVLVRPDGYLAAVTTIGHLDLLIGHLHSTMGGEDA